MRRRQYLRALAGSVGPATALSLSARDSAARSTHAGRTDRATGTATASPATETATPTDPAATPTSGYEPLGRVELPGAAEAVTTPAGGTAFVATGDGFAVVDLSDPANPAVAAEERDISPPGTTQVMQSVYDVKYDDGRLLVAGPANYDDDAFHGVALYDVADPAAPEFLRAHRTAHPVHNCDLSGEYAYLTGNDGEDNPLVVVDVGREDPREVARWSLFDHDPVWETVPVGLRTLHDVVVQDGRAYLAHWDAGTWVLDVSDPADPTYVADVRERPPEELADLQGLAVARERSEPPGNDHYAAPSPDGSLLAVGRETWNSNFGKEGTTPGPNDPGGPSGIALYDLSEPAEPTHLATIDPPPTADPNYNGVWTTAHNFEIQGGHLYSAWYRGGVAVHDLSDPASPERVRYFRRSSTTSFWTAQLAAPGEAVLATSYGDPTADLSPALYTFPDVARETPTAAPRATTETDAGGATDEVATTVTPNGSTGRPPTESTESAETGDATAGGGPGFGPAAALAGLGIGAWRLLAGTDECDGGGAGRVD